LRFDEMPAGAVMDEGNLDESRLTIGVLRVTL
jgi:hypothetical protein